MSALHGRGIGELEAALARRAPGRPSDEEAGRRGRAAAHRAHRPPERGQEQPAQPRPRRGPRPRRPPAGHDPRRHRRARRARGQAVRLHRHGGHPAKVEGRQGGQRRRVAERPLGHPRHRASARRRPHVRPDRGGRRAGREDPRAGRGARPGDGRRAQQERPAVQGRPREGRGERAREALVRAVRPGRPHERQDRTRRGRALRHDRSSAGRVPEAGLDGRAQSVLRAGDRAQAPAHDGRPLAAPLLRDAGRGLAAHVRRDDERAGRDPLLLQALRHQPAPRALRVRGGARSASTTRRGGAAEKTRRRRSRPKPHDSSATRHTATR